MSNIKEIKLADLAEDASFLSDLKEGKFVLVLGAGFSYGVPNKAGGTIPTVKEFIDITNNKFVASIDKGDYNTAADEWQRYVEETGIEAGTKENRFTEFKNLFLVNEELFQEKRERYSNILIPTWNHIYTFNFDNVLDVLVSDKKEKYEFQYLESGSFSPEKKQGIGYLHNSILKANSTSDLVFTNDQYGTKILEKGQDNHLYYALLNDIKTHKKNLVIIGCQFNEQSIYAYLF